MWYKDTPGQQDKRRCLVADDYKIKIKEMALYVRKVQIGIHDLWGIFITNK
jgi:hypothetical protein